MEQDQDPLEIPDPLQSAVDAVIRQRANRQFVPKKRIVKAGEFLSDRPREKAKRKNRREPEVPYIQPTLLERLAISGKWVKHSSFIRYAIWHCVRDTPQTAHIDDRTIWDRLGRWASETRSIKSLEDICGRHMAMGHLQRLVIGIRGIEANPVRSRLMENEVNQYLKRVVLAWEAALQRFLDVHPQYMQTPDEFAGFAPLFQVPDSVHHGLLDKPAVASKTEKHTPDGVQVDSAAAIRTDQEGG
jgi:hypothetical protein